MTSEALGLEIGWAQRVWGIEVPKWGP